MRKISFFHINNLWLSLFFTTGLKMWESLQFPYNLMFAMYGLRSKNAYLSRDDVVTGRKWGCAHPVVVFAMLQEVARAGSIYPRLCAVESGWLLWWINGPRRLSALIIIACSWAKFQGKDLISLSARDNNNGKSYIVRSNFSL